MTIHLRIETDSRGDAVDYRWYCSAGCYSDSLRADPPPPLAGDGYADGGTPYSADETAGLEEGGAYPCGAEHDGPDYCATCGDPIGNPLTDAGAEYVREYLDDVDARRYPHYDTDEARARAAALRATYPHIFQD